MALTSGKKLGPYGIQAPLKAGGTREAFMLAILVLIERSRSRLCLSSLPMMPIAYSGLFYVRWTIRTCFSFLMLAWLESTTLFRSLLRVTLGDPLDSGALP